MTKMKRFRDKNFPDLPDDHIVMSMHDPICRPCIRVYAKLTEDEELRHSIESRLAGIEKEIRETPHEEQKAKWRELNRRRALKKIEALKSKERKNP